MSYNSFESPKRLSKDFLGEIRKYKILTKEEEVFLIQKVKQGSRRAREILIQSHLRFVVKVALNYRNSGLSLADLVHEGTFGLVHAVDNFDQSRGLRFFSYAVWWIRGSISKAIDNQSMLIRLPSYQLLKIRKTLREHSEFQQIDSKEKELLEINKNVEAWDSGSSEEWGASDHISSPEEENPDHQLNLVEERHFIGKALNKLNEKERFIVCRVYGFENREHQYTLKEVADKLNISQERVRQLRDQALRRLKNSYYMNLVA